MNIFDPANSGKARVPSIDGIRGVAVLLVFFVHYVAVMSPYMNFKIINRNAFEFIGSYGNFGVDIFFIISGYLIYSIIMRDKFNYKIYMSRRFKRIYPTFLFVLLLYVLLSIIFKEESKISVKFPDNIYYVMQNMLLMPGVFNIKPIITVSWSLSYEMFFYLISPVVIYIFKFRDINSSRRISIVMLVLIVYYILSIFYLKRISRFSVFPLGFIAYEVSLKKWNIPYFKYLCPLVLIATCIIWYGVLHDYTDKVFAYILICWIYLVIFVNMIMSDNNGDAIYKVLNSKYVERFGYMSYTYFLLHGLTLKFVIYVFKNINNFPANSDYYFMLSLFPSFILTLIVSVIAYAYIEYPLSIKK